MGLIYDQARQQILAAGWQPARGTTYDDLSANETVFRERGDTEVKFCAVDRAASCRFEFTGPAGTLLVIHTVGEENTLLGTRALVQSTETSCPRAP